LSDHDGAWLAEQIRRLETPPPALILLRNLSHAGLAIDGKLFDRLINKPAKSGLLIRAIAQLTESSIAAQTKTPTQTRASALRTGIRVLLADDNVVNQKVTTHLLKRCGARVHCVGNGHEALQALRSGDFDVVLMDCQMPEMDGYEATRQLRNSPGLYKNPNIPVIALTANALASDHDQCIEAGMDDFLTKPIDRTRLEESLGRALLGSERRIAGSASGANSAPPTSRRV
jgi:two-component system sensor histidine kinase/response regulator